MKNLVQMGWGWSPKWLPHLDDLHCPDYFILHILHDATFFFPFVCKITKLLGSLIMKKCFPPHCIFKHDTTLFNHLWLGVILFVIIFCAFFYYFYFSKNILYVQQNVCMDFCRLIIVNNFGFILRKSNLKEYYITPLY